MALNPSPDELRELLVTLLAGAAGGTLKRWRQVLGEIETLRPIYLHVRGNWKLQPEGSEDELRAVDHAIEIVRAEHPYVREAH